MCHKCDQFMHQRKRATPPCNGILREIKNSGEKSAFLTPPAAKFTCAAQKRSQSDSNSKHLIGLHSHPQLMRK